MQSFQGEEVFGAPRLKFIVILLFIKVQVFVVDFFEEKEVSFRVGELAKPVLLCLLPLVCPDEK